MKLKTTITHEMQSYMDEPVHAYPKKLGTIAASIHSVFGKDKLPSAIILGYSRTYLRWMKPDGKGGLVPK